MPLKTFWCSGCQIAFLYVYVVCEILVNWLSCCFCTLNWCFSFVRFWIYFCWQAFWLCVDFKAFFRSILCPLCLMIGGGCLYLCRSFATKVYYMVTVGGVEISSMSNIVVPSRDIIARRLINSRLSLCQCRAKRNWRIWIDGSPSIVSSMLSTIQSSIRQAWAWSLRFVRKRIAFVSFVCLIICHRLNQSILFFNVT